MDPREELAALRRLAELEAKALGATAPAAPPGQIPGAGPYQAPPAEAQIPMGRRAIRFVRPTVEALGTAGGAVTFTLTLEFSNDGTTWLGGSTIFTDVGVTNTERAGMRVWVDFDAATFYKTEALTYATGAATNASLSAVSMRVRSSGTGGLDFSVSANFNGGIA
jgi:hypothetical protein